MSAHFWVGPGEGAPPLTSPFLLKLSEAVSISGGVPPSHKSLDDPDRGIRHHHIIAHTYLLTNNIINCPCCEQCRSFHRHPSTLIRSQWRSGGHRPSTSSSHLHDDITPTWLIVASPTTYLLVISFFYISVVHPSYQPMDRNVHFDIYQSLFS